jgi:hypothetical protein
VIKLNVECPLFSRNMSTAASFNTIHNEVASLCREVAQLRLELTSSHKASLREHLLSFLDSYPVLDTNYKKELVGTNNTFLII